jgi:hypothetical protein
MRMIAEALAPELSIVTPLGPHRFCPEESTTFKRSHAGTAASKARLGMPGRASRLDTIRVNFVENLITNETCTTKVGSSIITPCCR